MSALGKHQKPKSRGRQIGFWVLEVALAGGIFVLGVRGGLQLKPLQTSMAFEQSPGMGHLVLNSTFTVLMAASQEGVEPKHYFSSTEALRPWLQTATLPLKPGLPADNVVILLLESFGSEYTGVENGGQQRYTPFFDSLARLPDARLMPNHYANGRRSLEALPAVLAGLPALMEVPFIATTKPTNCTDWAICCFAMVTVRPCTLAPPMALWGLMRFPALWAYSITTVLTSIPAALKVLTTTATGAFSMCLIYKL